MSEIIILAIALSMDAFAVAIGLGSRKNTKMFAIRVALYFGIFQGVMPLIGYLVGKGALSLFEGYTDLLAFILLSAIGLKMLYEANSKEDENQEDKSTDFASNKLLFILAIATSIDAMAAGYSLNLFVINPYISCIIIAVVTFFFSFFGVFLGKRSGTYLEKKAEIFGGVVLILLGLKLLLR